ncbi:50S ribosomal protein L25 [Anaerococcus sp. Marseille-P3625]|uniref:50S ribosomal protein L25 n=1 Tax=Anaerococcus sp. Marseille-P3625 TaxID=1977277 RepID=UPI000C06C6F6|nr:50S ribosomal protein L25 [Anaerococcus sp. Marseille-P3625]
MADLVLNANKRDAVGKNKVNKLRAEEIIPGVIYAKGEENLNVQIISKDFDRILRKAGTSTIITLDIDGENKDVLIKEYQTHPYKNQYLHVDFQAINQNETIRVSVPIVLVGRDDIEIAQSVLVQNMDTIEVECLPKYIPQAADVNVTDIQIGDNKTVADLDIFANENITVLEDEDEVICSLQEVSEEKEDSEEDGLEASASDVPTVNETEQKEEN